MNSYLSSSDTKWLISPIVSAGFQLYIWVVNTVSVKEEFYFIVRIDIPSFSSIKEQFGVAVFTFVKKLSVYICSYPHTHVFVPFFTLAKTSNIEQRHHKHIHLCFALRVISVAPVFSH